MIEESEKLKSELEGKAEHYADKLVPWTLGATGLTYLLTRNVTKGYVNSHGGFLLCTQACYANLCAFCYQRGKPL